MISFFVNGGIFMWAILLFFICGLAIILEKFWFFLTKENLYTEKYKKELFEMIKTKNREKILKLCKNRKDTVSKLVVRILRNLEIDFENVLDTDKKYMKNIIEEAILEETMILEKGMWLLGSVVNIAPQLGLLGTVTGMITSFSALLNNGSENTRLVAVGISEALYTTAFGLIVAIPTLFCYNLFNKKIDSIVAEIDKVSLNFINIIEKSN